MQVWQIAIAALALAWALQAAGTFVQMRHYAQVMGEVSARYGDGFVGAGAAKATLGRGAVVLLVVSPDRIVRRLLVMQGRSVFAKFQQVADYDGMSTEGLRGGAVFPDRGRSKALAMAIGQVEKVIEARSPPRAVSEAA